MEAILNDIGWVQDVIVNKRTGHLIDGHLRVTLALRNDENSIPVKYVDLSENEEKVVLATYDPLSEMAEADKEILQALLAEVNSTNSEIQETLSALAEENGLLQDFEPATLEDQQSLDTKLSTTVCPACGHEW